MIRRLVVTLLAASLPAPVLAAQDLAQELAVLQQRESQLFATGWRLARANAPFCRDTVLAIGMLLHDAQAYGRPADVRAALGLSGDIGVQAVAPGSPAQTAGLKANDTLERVGDTVIVAEYPATEPRWQRMVALQDAIDAAFRGNAGSSVGWQESTGRSRTASITAVPVCASRFEVQSSGQRALAEGTRVIFGRDFPAFSYAEDEFAAAVAHELAHNLLAHRALLDAIGRSQAAVRLTERDADRLMPWLLHNAGYDPAAAIRFMERWGPRYGGGLLRKRTHDGWDERVEAIAAEIETLRGIIGTGGPADWSRHFRAEAAPAGGD